ncbi:MAG: YaaR family protein [Spirochaetaceae bacterium]|nr:YaaR family protein [Spirochaetaceae bacterium]
MDITTTKASLAAVKASSEKKRKKEIERSSSFHVALDSAIHSEELAVKPLEVSDKAIEDLLAKVFTLGNELKRQHTLSKLGEYRSSIRRFLNFVIDNAYQAEKVQGALNKRTLRSKGYDVVYVVDEKLDKLARTVLNEQQDVLAILAQVEEINGLLINFWR